MRSVWVFALGLLFLAGPTWAAEEASFDSQGAKLFYTVAGDGEPVVLIHGLAASSLVNWELPGVVKELAPTYRVIALDCRGHGRSAKPHDPQSYGIEMVNDVVRLLDHLKIDKAHVVGYSMGGLIAHKFAVLHPDRLLSLTLSGMGWLDTNEDQVKQGNEEVAQSLEEGKGLGPLIGFLAPSGKPQPTDEQIKQINQVVLATNDAQALAAAIRGFGAFAVSEQELKANAVPTLALIGGLDPLKAGVDRLKAVRPSVEVVEIENADHVNAVAQPKFVATLKQFLAQHPRK